MNELSWVFWPWQRRCDARLERKAGAWYWGRCDLRVHGEDVDHALERGMMTPRWSTALTGY